MHMRKTLRLKRIYFAKFYLNIYTHRYIHTYTWDGSIYRVFEITKFIQDYFFSFFLEEKKTDLCDTNAHAVVSELRAELIKHQTNEYQSNFLLRFSFCYRLG